MVQRIEIGRGSDNVTFNVYLDASNFVSVDRTGVMSYLNGPQRRDNALVSQCASDVLQMLWDNVMPLTDLHPEDPDFITDPAQPNNFHARIADSWGQGANKVDVYRPIALVGGTATHLVGRSTLLTVIYTGSIDTATIRTESPPQNLR